MCFKEKRNHSLIQLLLDFGFEQKVQEPTQIAGGTIDQVYYRKGRGVKYIDVKLYSPYYTALDHDALCVTIIKSEE